MIIHRRRNTHLFITQPDHAALAAEIMGAWQVAGFPTHPRRERVLFAVREHDNGWIEEDRLTHVGADGHALDFMSVPPEVKHRIWPRAVERIGRERPYEAALVAQHALTVHGEQRANPAWRGFFDTMERCRAALLAPATAGATFEADYRFVRIGDLLSLIFCNGWTEAFALSDGRQAILTGSSLTITPEPFAGARIPLRIAARRLPVRTYRTAGDLRDALASAPLEWLEGEASGRADAGSG